MSVKQIILCDGCGKYNEIADSLREGESQIDICKSCESLGGYICFQCPEVHFAKYACPKQHFPASSQIIQREVAA